MTTCDLAFVTKRLKFVYLNYSLFLFFLRNSEDGGGRESPFTLQEKSIDYSTRANCKLCLNNFLLQNNYQTCKTRNPVKKNHNILFFAFWCKNIL